MDLGVDFREITEIEIVGIDNDIKQACSSEGVTKADPWRVSILKGRKKGIQ